MDRTGAEQAGQWLTYAEAGKRFGITQEAARQLARRRGWQRRTPNEPNETARIFVPDEAYVRPRTPVTGEHMVSAQPPANGEDRASEINIRSAELVLRERLADKDAVLADRDTVIIGLRNRLDLADRQIEREQTRADWAERQLGAEREEGNKARGRIDELFSMLEVSNRTLADAVAAQRIAAGEAAALRAELDQRREWRLLRRLRWAIRRS